MRGEDAAISLINAYNRDFDCGYKIPETPQPRLWFNKILRTRIRTVHSLRTWGQRVPWHCVPVCGAYLFNLRYHLVLYTRIRPDYEIK